jgi:hypothetical protein
VPRRHCPRRAVVCSTPRLQKGRDLLSLRAGRAPYPFPGFLRHPIRPLERHLRNETVLGKYPHFGFYLSKFLYGWVRDHQGFEINPSDILSPALDLYGSATPGKPSLTQHAAFFKARDRLYFPTHSRYGAMVLGMLFAFFLADGQPTKGKIAQVLCRCKRSPSHIPTVPRPLSRQCNCRLKTNEISTSSI